MPFNTIVVHIDETERSDARVRLAAQLAIQNDAHLIGSAVTGVARFIYQEGNIGLVDPNLVEHLTMLRQRAEQVAKKFHLLVQKLGVNSYESIVTNDEAGDGIGLQARYSDLVVIGQNNPDAPSSSVSPDFPQHMIIHSGRPVLIVPYVGEFEQLGKRPLVAWDGSREAARAISDALPLLQAADLVNIIVFNPDKAAQPHGEEAGADIGLFLARHDVKVEVIRQKSVIDIGNALLSLSHDINSDLLVMGGYGHSRFREMMMGGVTRTILSSMTLPVLMSH